MAEPVTNVEDLEDGEIESEGEETIENQNEEKKEDIVPAAEENLPQDKLDTQDFYYSKSGKKKKSKSKDQKSKDKSKKNRKFANPTEDDFAGNIEKAIRKAMNKSDDGESYPQEEVEERRKHKKRKKNEGKDGVSKKRKKHEYNDEMDENEMMCVRGASPVHKPAEAFDEDDRDSYASDSSHEDRGHQQHRSQRHRPSQRERNKNKNDRRRGGAHPMQDADGLCSYYMQGKCHKGDDCIYSHDAQPPRKMELCKFYLMDCCAKRDKCLYMHADFPCKYYHTGLPCIYKDECKFAHGKPLNESLKNILLKHIESAPKEILGDFPRLHREGALQMIQTTQMKLMQQFSETSDSEDKNIPSLFDLNIPNPQFGPDSSQPVNSYEKQNKISPKVRQSRWQNDNSNQNFNTNVPPQNTASTTNVLSIKNLTGVLTPRQISDLTKMGIDNLDQLGQLTVLQLNSIGISLKQITEIQLNTMSIQKLGLINANAEQQTSQFINSNPAPKDLDLRVPPAVPVSNNVTVSSDFPGQDIDMRFQPSVAAQTAEEAVMTNTRKDIQGNKDMIDIDQYTKDALKFASKDKENIDISNDTFNNEKSVHSVESKDVDHRVVPFSEDAPRIIHSAAEDNTMKKECDTDIRFLQPEPIFKNPEKRHRRSTTDDEDNLLIDEKWYSSDEEKCSRKKSPASSPRPASISMQVPAPAPHVIEPAAVLSQLGDLSKIDISEEVTKLLNTMKNNMHDNKVESNDETIHSPKLRDPRARRSPDKVSETSKVVSKKPQRISIYECVDGEPTDGRRRSDVDLRQTEYKIPTFGDTDLRQGSSGDIDFRLGLPFKAIPNYTPASEINGSINSHPPISYKLVPIEIPRPDYTDIRNSTAKSQALVDPRLRKVFRLSIDETNSDSEKTTKPSPAPAAPRVDPRRKPSETISQESKPNTLELQNVLQNSNWYKDLSSTQKIFVNQHLAPVSQMIKQHQQDRMPGKKIDLSGIQNNSILCSIFTNLGLALGENGEFSYLPKPKEALLKTPVSFNQNSPFGMNPGPMDGNNMNLMNIPPMGMGGMNNMNVGPMGGFNQSLPDPRGGPTPGLLGIAPNMPHNFNNGKFGGPNNFGNMPFNGPGPMNDFNFMDGEQNFPRFPNRGGMRGRGNERWNRGGGGRGHRDRKNFSDRGGNWKNDRH